MLSKPRPEKGGKNVVWGRRLISSPFQQLHAKSRIPLVDLLEAWLEKQNVKRDVMVKALNGDWSIHPTDVLPICFKGEGLFSVPQLHDFVYGPT